MEFRSENSKAHCSSSSRRTPNQQTCIANEDIVFTSDMSIERSDVVEIEKTMVIQKNIIINEKHVVPKAMVSFPTNPILYGNQALCIDSNAILISCEGGFQNSQDSGKMEIASQESLDSKMDISSQSSHLSAMEYSSQESDVAIEPAKIVNSPQAICDGDLSKENCAMGHPLDVLPKVENYGQKVPRSEEPIFPQEDIPDDFLNTKGGISNIQGYVNYEAGLENEMGYFKRKYSDRRFSTEKSLLSREEAVAAREAACMCRERAIGEREASIASEGTHSREATDNGVPSPKRLKLISAFEYS